MRLTVSKAALATLLVVLASASAAQTASANASAAARQRRHPERSIRRHPGAGRRPRQHDATTAPPEPQPNDTNAQRAKSQPLNNAPFWRGVHNSGSAPGTVNNLQVGERGELIQPITSYPGTRTTTAGEAWRQIRNWWIVPYGGALLVIVVFAIGLYFFTKGPIGGHERRHRPRHRALHLLRASRALGERDRVLHPRRLRARDGVRQVLPPADPRRDLVRLAHLAAQDDAQLRRPAVRGVARDRLSHLPAQRVADARGPRMAAPRRRHVRRAESRRRTASTRARS